LHQPIKHGKKITTLLDYISETAINNDLCISELSEKAGFHSGQAARWIDGKANPTLFNFLKLCQAAGKVIELKGKGMQFKYMVK